MMTKDLSPRPLQQTCHPESARPALAASLSLLVSPLLAGPALAGGLSVEVTLPELDANPYYRPYLAAWIEDPATKEIRGTVAVWYDTKLRDNLGRGFLRDLRSWWRAEGEKLDLPADGLSGPTRGPGRHEISLSDDNAVLKDLGPGDYILAVEVSREGGGREILRAPFAWGGAENSAEAGEGSASEIGGEREISRLKVVVKP